MKKLKNNKQRWRHSFLLYFVPFMLIASFIFRTWFGMTPLSSGDWSYHFPEEVRSFSFTPISWNSAWGGGLGRNSIFFAPLETYFRGMASFVLNTLQLTWPVYERVVWYWPYLLVAAAGAVYFTSFFVPLTTAALVAPIVFVTNTYALILTSGGQMGVAMAYAVAPWVIGYAMRKRRIVVTAILFAIQILFDSRIFYLTFFCLGGYVLLSCIAHRESVKTVCSSIVRHLVLPLCIALGLHAWWIIPMLVYRNNPIGELGPAYNSIAALRFFSFTDFSHAFALMHGNFPENVFGKTGFLQSEFLLNPLVAFSGLLLVSNKKKLSVESTIPASPAGRHDLRPTICLALLGLLGVFLTKGANEPFGFVYEWLFQHIPGFNVFRDSSKFFLIVVLSYTVLIAHSMNVFSEKIRKPWGKALLFSLFFFFWMMTIRGTWMGVTKGTLVTHTIPDSYQEVKELILKDPHFSRSLWVPQIHRYAINTDLHPAISAQDAFGVASQSAVVDILSHTSLGTAFQLSNWAVKYIIVPQDTHNELFLDDRAYSFTKRQEVVKALDNNLLFTRVALSTQSIDVYEYKHERDHFFMAWGEPVTWQRQNVTSYTVKIPEKANISQLVFSESFDPGWVLRSKDKETLSHATQYGLNGFDTQGFEGKEVKIIYKPHELLMKSLWISGAVLVAVCFFLVAPLVQYK